MEAFDLARFQDEYIKPLCQLSILNLASNARLELASPFTDDRLAICSLTISVIRHLVEMNGFEPLYADVSDQCRNHLATSRYYYR